MVVDDEVLIAEDISNLCEDIGFPPVCIAHTAGQAIDYLSNNEVDLVLLDINLEDELDGVDIAEYINKNTNSNFIFLTSYSDQGTLARVTKTNPSGYIVKPFNKEQLLSTIILTITNRKGRHTKVTLEMINEFTASKVSEREYEIIEYICAGKRNAEIAEICFLSINTVKYHIKQIFSRLGVKSRMELLSLIRDIQKKM